LTNENEDRICIGIQIICRAFNKYPRASHPMFVFKLGAQWDDVDKARRLSNCGSRA